MKRYLLTLAFGAGLVGCYEPIAQADNSSGVQIPSAQEIAAKKEQHFAQQLSKLQQRNPEQEAQQAIQNGERYFLCGVGRGAALPGLTAQPSTNCPTRCLDGVSDTLYGPQHRAYLKVALDYSARWNQQMLKACP